MFATLDLPLRDDNRHKRLKVGRACHPCRMKKIKCDGKQPCMQVKARRRKCMYLKNTEATYIKRDPDDTLLANEVDGESMDDDEPCHQTTGSNSNNNNATITRSDKMMEQLAQGLVQLTLHQDLSGLKKPVAPWQNYGDLVRWSNEPEFYPNNNNRSTDMPDKETQEQLVQVFFTHCHTLLPTMSKSMFYDQLHSKGPLITPLLLNMIYAHASAYQHQQRIHDQPPPPLGIPAVSSIYSSSPSTTTTHKDVFYQRARQLLDDFMDVPRISTVIALLYMVSYEDNHNTTQGRSSRAWMYSGMAIRMCLELGLHTSHYSSQMSQFDIELRKRVLWTCYVMDKLESCTMERPWMLRSQDITLDLPTPLPEDDQKERAVLDGFGHLCRLMMLVEKVLSFFTYDNNNGGQQHEEEDWTTRKESQVLYFLEKLVQWRDQLPDELQWRPANNNYPGSSIVTNLHLLAYDLELSLVLCCRFQMEPIQGERRRSVAMVITHLVNCTIQHPSLMYTSSVSAFSGIFAALVHALDVDHSVLNIAKEAKQQLKLTLEMIRGLVDRIPVRNVQSFVISIDSFLHPSSSSTTTQSSSPFLFNSTTMQQHVYHLNNNNMTSSTATTSQAPPIMTNNESNTNNHSINTTESLSISDHDKIIQHMLGSNDLYEAQMLAKTMSTLQQHHQHHRGFPTPFTTPSPPPTTTTLLSPSSLLNNNINQQQHLFTCRHPLQEGHQQLYPAISSSSSVSSSSSSPPTSLKTTASIIPGMASFDFTSHEASAAAAAAVGAVGPPLTNHPSSRDMMPSMTIPTSSSSVLKNIEPADYTFELISVDDEWAKSLIY
ncbi:fungal-specific transcription factor domain-containing protein [Chlamydoabsidia padenii]|nr:fungal-specific transcription factor domain-containing protein [Chlamydoabsidia padenii]